jgi:uncharacterized protein with gpF-like domain
VTPAELEFWRRLQRRAAALQSDLNRAILRAFQNLRDGLSERQMAHLIATGQIDELVNDVFGQVAQNAAFTPMRSAMQTGVTKQVQLAAAEIPGARVNGRVLVSFDYLNPRVIDAVRTLDSKIITTLQADTRETVRAFAENGLRDGKSAVTVARQIRDVVGLSPTQESYVRNLRTELEAGQYGTAAQRVLLDQRYNLSKIDGLSTSDRAKRIDTIVGAYRKSYIAFNAESNARTAALDSTKLGQRLSWQDAIDKGIVDGDRLQKTWRGVKDNRERPEHYAMEGETVGFDEAFSNGEMTPGDSTYNCRCVPIMSVGG